jgi:fructose-specific phosphotransferase system component IIB
MNARIIYFKKLQKLQSRAARVITGSSYEISSENILSELDWLPLEDRFRNKKTMLAYNVKNNIKLPQSIIGKFEMKNNSNHNLRNNNTDFVLKETEN